MYKINTLSKKAVIFFLIVVIVIIGITSVSYAYWGGNATRELTNEESPTLNLEEDLTYRYMIFQVNNLDTMSYYLRYNDNGYYDYFNLDEETVSEEIKDAAKDSFSATQTVELVLYTGALGEYESIVVPEKINVYKGVDASNNNAPILVEMNVTSINLRIAEMSQTKDLIKSVIIPGTVLDIKGYSFSSFNLLESVYFRGTTVPNISYESFRNPTPTFYDSTNTQISITRQARAS